jgi:HECT-like Ubiquitin-conjugating enzyme (E2)-binding
VFVRVRVCLSVCVHVCLLIYLSSSSSTIVAVFSFSSLLLSSPLSSSLLFSPLSSLLYSLHTSLTRCAHSLLAAAQAHTSYRFLLCDHQNQPRLQLHILSWETKIFFESVDLSAPVPVPALPLPASADLAASVSSPASRGSAHDVRPLRSSAIKLLFVDCLTSDHAQVDAWCKKFAPERIPLQAQHCDRVCAHLIASNRLLPPSRRQFEAHSVGFLPLLE